MISKSNLKLPVSSLCCLCHSADETIDHLISSCSFIAQSHYKKRHDVVALYIHWKLTSDAEFEAVIAGRSIFQNRFWKTMYVTLWDYVYKVLLVYHWHIGSYCN